MSDFDTLQATIADFANRQDWSPALVQSFIAMAEQKLNAELRVDRMITTSQNTVTDACSTLPDDWLESDFMLIASQNTPTGWSPIRYKPRDEFFRMSSRPYSGMWTNTYNSTWGYYTIEGRTIWFGGPVDDLEGTVYQMNYYQEVPVMATTLSSWVYTKYPSLYLYASLMHADLHAVGEEDKAGAMKQLTEDTIAKLNADHQRARASGSRLARTRVRSFG
jgi:hypothetical protein